MTTRGKERGRPKTSKTTRTKALKIAKQKDVVSEDRNYSDEDIDNLLEGLSTPGQVERERTIESEERIREAEERAKEAEERAREAEERAKDMEERTSEARERERREREERAEEMEERTRETRERDRRERERERREDRERDVEARERETERRERERREAGRRGREKQKERSENERIHIPPQLEDMDKLQICTWMVDHPDILQLSCNMFNMKHQAISPSSTSTLPPLQLSESSDNDKYRLLDEELKILFLKTRNPPDHAFVKLIKKIFNVNAHTNLACVMIKRSRSAFSDYRYSLKNSLELLVKEFLRDESAEVLLQDDIDNFISREVVFKRIFRRYMSSVDISELTSQTIDKLVDLCRKCFMIVWEERGKESKVIYERIKLLDIETEDLVIPSRSGENVTTANRHQ